MARLTGENIEQYRAPSGRKTGFFKLVNDKDTARVRFLYNSVEDIEGFTVHKVKVGDKDRYVNCLMEKDGRIDDCPFCRAKVFKQARVIMPVYNEDADQIQLWDRPNSFYGKIANYCSRYTPPVGMLTDIQRNGKAGYQKTEYDLYPVGQSDGTTIEDILEDCELEEMPAIIGGLILDKSVEDMEEYLETGDFPSTEDVPVRRRSRSDDRDEQEEAPRRRESGRGRRDRF